MTKDININSNFYLIKKNERIHGDEFSCLSKIADDALKSLLTINACEINNASKKHESDIKRINLLPPSKNILDNLNSNGKLTKLLSQLVEILNNTTLSQINSRLHDLFISLENKKKNAEGISNVFNESLEQSNELLNTYEVKLKKLNKLNAKIIENIERIEQLKLELINLSQSNESVSAIKNTLDKECKELELNKNSIVVIENEVLIAHSHAIEELKKTNDLLTEFKKLNVNTDNSPFEKNISSIAKLTMLMSIFIKLINKNNEDSLKNDIELFRSIQEARQKEMDQKSIAYQQEIKKAEKINSVMGWLGKIVGAILTITSLIGAVFSGGATLAFAMLGLGIMLSDEIVKATTGKSFIQGALNPIIENIFTPLMEFISQEITKFFESMGCDKKTAELIGGIFGAVISAIAMVAATIAISILGKSAAAKIGDVLGKQIIQAIKKYIPQGIGNLTHSINNAITKEMKNFLVNLNKIGLKNDSLSKELIANSINKYVMGFDLANTTAQAVGNISEGVFIKNASEHISHFTVAQFSVESIRKWLSMAFDKFSDNLQLSEKIQIEMSSILQNRSNTSRFILRNINA